MFGGMFFGLAFADFYSLSCFFRVSFNAAAAFLSVSGPKPHAEGGRGPATKAGDLLPFEAGQ